MEIDRAWPSHAAIVSSTIWRRAWREPDEGIWEVRGGPQHFVHSKVMAWVSF